MLQSPISLTQQQTMLAHDQRMNGPHDLMNDADANDAAVAAAAAAGFSLPPGPPTPGGQMGTIPQPPYTPGYNYPPPPGTPSVPIPLEHPQAPQQPATPAPSGSYDPMFGTIPTNARSSPAPWAGDEQARVKPAGQVLAHSPGGSHNGSTTTATQGEEKDPFLSLLEQLAENEQANGQAGELDLFLAGAPSSG